MPASVARKRRRIEARAAKINADISALNDAILRLGPFDVSEWKMELKLGVANLENELADLALEAMALASPPPSRTSARG